VEKAFATNASETQGTQRVNKKMAAGVGNTDSHFRLRELDS